MAISQKTSVIAFSIFFAGLVLPSETRSTQTDSKAEVPNSLAAQNITFPIGDDLGVLKSLVNINIAWGRNSGGSSGGGSGGAGGGSGGGSNNGGSGGGGSVSPSGASSIYFSAARKTSYRGEKGVQCQAGWLGFNSHCYLFSKKKATWDAALSACEGNKSELAAVTYAEENNFFLETVKSRNLGEYLHIGLRKYNEFKWVDNNVLGNTSYKNWDSLYTETWGGHECVALYYDSFASGSSENGKWRTVNCDKEASFVCETTGVLKSPDEKLSFDTVFAQSEDKAFNKSSGVFTAPANGVYQFRWTAAQDGGNDLKMDLYKEAEFVAQSYTMEARASGTPYKVVGNQAMILVCRGERVFLETVGNVFGDDKYDTTFSGNLISSAPWMNKKCPGSN